jgi:SAM-dependent methyltransferase
MANKLTMRDRAAAYAAAFPEFPDSHFMVSDRWISATWIMGNNYRSLSKRGEDDKPYFGSYPPGYLRRIWPMFNDANRILHLFSGSLTKEAGDPPWSADRNRPVRCLRIDARAELKPDMVRDAENFVNMPSVGDDLNIETASLDLILADPPYSIEDAENYGRPLCNKRKVLEQCHLALKPGGHLLWMDQAIPMFSKKNWKWVGVISMYRSTNHRIRGVMMFEKV